MDDVQPAPPARQFHQIVGPHQPNEFCVREAPQQQAQRIHGKMAVQRGLDSGRHDAAPVRDGPSTGQALCQRRHAGARFQRIAGGYEQPNLIQPQALAGQGGDMAMPFMRGVERPAEQPYVRPASIAESGKRVWNQGRICPVPVTR